MKLPLWELQPIIGVSSVSEVAVFSVASELIFLKHAKIDIPSFLTDIATHTIIRKNIVWR